MRVLGALACGAILFAGAAGADTISAFSEDGQKKELDTAKLAGCELIFDSAGTPFQVCKMEKVEFRPPSSTRSRPGHADKVVNVQVLYKKAEN